MRNYAFLAGRIILGMYYLMNAFNHFTMLGMMSQWVASKGVPLPKLAVLGTGLLLLLAGLSILLGIYPRIGVLLLVIFFLPVTFMMHNFWSETDPMMRMNQMVQFMKNLALMGSALIFLAIPEPWPLSLGKKS
jgi:uncharacterized membrane protein YphA (DoxX/SURF4 family)